MAVTEPQNKEYERAVKLFRDVDGMDQEAAENAAQCAIFGGDVVYEK